MVSKQQRVMACVTAGLVAFVLGLVAWPTGGSSPAPASGPKAPASEPKQGQPLDLPPGPTVDPEEVVEKSFKIAAARAVAGGSLVIVSSHKSTRKRDPMCPERWIYSDHPDCETVVVTRELWEKAREAAGGKIRAGDAIKAKGKLKVRLDQDGGFSKPSLSASEISIVK